ncbi:hypothetical protein B0H14DRAFT_3746961 [Mycena olivaceomarginata]|nr:hypothetical protein B0H14DRAFT_3746961 [Mycena olivaceomarginata]
MALSRRGTRSTEKARSRKTKYLKPGGVYDKGQKKIRRKTETLKLDKFPGEFLVSARDSKHVQRVIHDNYTPIAELPSLGESDNNVLIVPSPLLSRDQQALVGPAQMARYNFKRPGVTSSMVDFLNGVGPVPFLLLRCSNVLSPAIQARFYKAFHDFRDAKPATPPCEPTRSSTPAYHFGVWSVFQNEPMLSTDTRQPTKCATQQAILIPLIDKLLRLVQKHMVPRARRIIERHAPQQLQILAPVYDRVKTVLAEEFAARPALDFGGLWFMVAVKEGSSEIIHLDFNDTHALVAFIWVISPPNSLWTGGEFCAPQLGGKIPFRPGQMIAARTRILAHCGATVRGKGRITFTCFSDSQLVEQTLFGPSVCGKKGAHDVRNAAVVIDL